MTQRRLATASARFALFLAVLTVPGAIVAAIPQPIVGLTSSGQPDTIVLTGQAASVPGFRSALWGMTPDEVRAALARDFGGAKASALITDPVTGNRAMIAPMSVLAPGPGPAAISYVFGARSKRLIHVNLDWTVKAPTAAERTAMIAGGSQVVAGFVGNQWKLGSVMRGVVVEPDLIVLFAGADDAGGGVDVRVGGVPYTLGSGASVRTIAPPSEAATLHVSFSAPKVAKADETIKPGAF